MADKYGIKVALPDFGVKDAKPEECSITPEFPCMKIKLKQVPPHFGVFTKTFSSTPATGETALLTINHNLGYKPAHLCLIKYAVSGVSRALPLPAYSGISLAIYAYVSTTQFKIMMNRQVGGTDPNGETWIFKYYIFVENGA